jgi:hypothetical protein
MNAVVIFISVTTIVLNIVGILVVGVFIFYVIGVGVWIVR